jgi:hypothetical protein
MSRRIGKSWTVLTSIENGDGLRCVDLFRRPDGTFGYGEFHRDPEDQGVWTPVRFASVFSYGSLQEARAAAATAIAWMREDDLAAEPVGR